MRRMLSVACLERKKMRAPAQFWAGFEKTPRGDKRKHKITAKSANAVSHCLSAGPRFEKRSNSNSMLFVTVLVSQFQKVQFLDALASLLLVIT